MGLFRSDEEKVREQAEREQHELEAAARREAAQQQRARQAWLASPVGQATTAREAGQAFFEVQLEVGRNEREAMWGTRDYSSAEQTTSSAGVLGEIEKVGWSLEHVGYVFKVTGRPAQSEASSAPNRPR